MADDYETSDGKKRKVPNNGGNGLSAGEVARRQEAYIENRLEFKGRRESAQLAGYGASAKAIDIERAGNPPVGMRLRNAFIERGMDEGWLSDQYCSAMQEARRTGAKDKDYGALARMLYQVQMALGYGKQPTPSVAVQINNGSAKEIEPAGGQDLLERLEGLIGKLEEIAGEGDVPGVHAGDNQPQDAQACDGMGGTAQGQQETAGGGQP